MKVASRLGDLVHFVALNVRLLPALKLFFKRSNDLMGQASVSCASRYFGGLGWEDDYRGVSHVLRHPPVA